MVVVILLVFLFGSSLAQTSTTRRPGTPPPLCSFRFDVVLLVDSSVNETEWSTMKNGITAVLRSGLIGLADTRFAGVQMTGLEPTTDFDLQTFNTTEAVINGIDGIILRGGEHRGQEGLEHVEEQIFQEANGDRQDAANAVIYVAGSPSITSLDEPANRMKQAGVRMRAIGLMLDGNDGETARQQLKALTDNDPTLFLDIESFDDLEGRSFARRIANFFCSIEE